MPDSSWLIGSYPSMPEQTLSVTANAVTADVTIDAGSYYLHDHLSSRSLVEVTAAAIQSHTQITTCTGILSRDRMVRFTADIAFSLTWTDTVARDVLGFTGNLTPADTTHVADVVSQYLWVPDRESDPDARLGRDGDVMYDTVVSSSGGSDAHIVATQHDSRVINEFDFHHVRTAYFDTGVDVNNGGQYRAFFTEVLRRFRRFKVYENTLHDENSSTDVGLLAGDALGPYRFRPAGGGPIRFSNVRHIPKVEKYHRAVLPVVLTSEYA